MVREVSEDRIYDTIEFNEFLQMLSKQQRNYTQDSLRDAFRYKSNFSTNGFFLCAFDFLRLVTFAYSREFTSVISTHCCVEKYNKMQKLS